MPQVARPHSNVHRPNGEEQSGLKQSVGAQHHEARQRHLRLAVSHHDRDETQLGHRTERQHELEIVLLERTVSADQQRTDSSNQHHRPPRHDIRESRREPRHQIHSGLHHGRSVQVGGNRRWCRHGRGEPEVERDERGLRERPDQHKNYGRGKQRGPSITQMSLLGGRDNFRKGE